ncbi:RNA polymerase sigma factor [Geodermatophilus sp. SYSU D00758]
MEPALVTALVRRAADGDGSAWDAIVAEYAGMVRSVARGFGLTDAQASDVVQTTWLRLVEHLAGIRDPQRLAGWLRTTARRASLAVLRDAHREQPVPPPDRSEVVDEAGPEVSAVRRDQEVLLRRAVATLPPRHRQLLGLLTASPPASYEEISAGLGMPVGSIGPTRARVLTRLRAELATAGLHDLSLN